MASIQLKLFPDKPKSGPKRKTDPAPAGKKQCAKCRKIKPVASFSRDKSRYDGLYWRCKQCLAEYHKTRRAEHKALMLKGLYGLTEDAYWQLLSEQGGVCAICNRPETKKIKGVLAHLAVDHDHATGQIRGLLCNSCNCALGHMRDDVGLLQRAIAYLTRD